tara:strand:- start:11322 stop:12425 length:1104 start_codon:yes stop_codon:yes gene_type:complete
MARYGRKYPLAFALPNFNGGGAERVFIDLANEAVLFGEVIILVNSESGPLRDRLRPEIRVVRIEEKKIVRQVSLIVAACKKNRIKTLIGTLAMAYKVALARPFLVTQCVCIARVGNSISAENSYKPRSIALLHRCYAHSLLLASKVVAQTTDMERDLLTVLIFKNLLSKKIHVIGNPAPRLDSSASDVDFSPFNDRLASVTPPVRFLAVGRLEPQKDHRTLIQAFAIVSRRIESELHILGAGSLCGSLTAYANETCPAGRVFFHGFVDNTREFYAHSDVFVLSSLYEGLSNALIEAVAYGLPVVATDCPGGNSQIVRSEDVGFLVPVQDSQALADAMCRAASFEPSPAAKSTLASRFGVLVEYMKIA